MRRIPTRHLKEGSIIATDIYDSNGKVLIGKNTKVDAKRIEALKRYKILSVYVVDEYSPEIFEDIIGEKLRVNAVMELKSMALEFRKIDFTERGTVVKQEYLRRIVQMLNEITDELLAKKTPIIEQIDIRDMENYRYYHAVNVAVMSIIIGMELGYSRRKLRNLALGALLHDVGKTLLPDELIDKSGGRSLEEETELKSHCKLGYKYSREFKSLDEEVRLVILDHHENVDGSGYPRGINGDKINELTKIVAILNFYDNFMATGYMLNDSLPSNVLEQIMAYVDLNFDFDIVRVFLRKVKPFIKGTMVKLNTGDIAIVEGTIQGAPLRPLVRVIKSTDLSKINKVINLVDKLDVTIVELVYYREDV